MNAQLDRYIHEVHLNLNVRGLSISPTLAINELSRSLVENGRSVFKLGLGQSPFPVPEPVVQALADVFETDWALAGGAELHQAPGQILGRGTRQVDDATIQVVLAARSQAFNFG